MTNVTEDLTFTMEDLPREIIYKILSKLDIDSRRALGIYTKIKTPPELEIKISNSFIMDKMPANATSKDEAFVLFQFPYFDEEMKEFYLNLMYSDMMDMPLLSKKKRVMMTLISWFENFEFGSPGITIKAGIPDGQDAMIIDYKIEPCDYIVYGVNQTNFSLFLQ